MTEREYVLPHNQPKAIPCAYCSNGADDRPVYTEYVCWNCWAQLYGGEPTNEHTLKAFEAGQRSATRTIVAWLREGAAGKRGSKVPEWIPLAYRIEHGEHHGNEVDSRKAYEEWDENVSDEIEEGAHNEQ